MVLHEHVQLESKNKSILKLKKRIPLVPESETLAFSLAAKDVILFFICLAVYFIINMLLSVEIGLFVFGFIVFIL